LAKADYLVVLNSEADGMSEAIRTRETFNAPVKEVCDTFKMEKFHEEQQKAIDLFSDGERYLYFIACNGIGNRALLKQKIHCITANLKVVTGLHDSCRTKDSRKCVFFAPLPFSLRPLDLLRRFARFHEGHFILWNREDFK